MKDRRFRGTDWLIVAALVALVGTLYTRTAGFEFTNYDDDQYIYENPHIRSGLTFKAVTWAFGNAYASNWHPLTWMSHMLDVELFGVTPGGPHLVNAILHAANSALLYAALFRLTGSRWPAAFCAAFFAVHPLRVESVAWISERKDVLSGLFWMLALIAYERYARHPSAGRYVFVLALFVLGLLSKPMVITLPFVLLLLDYWPLGRVAERKDWRRLVLEKLPMLALAAGSAVATFLAQQAGQSVASAAGLSLKLRLLNAITAYCEYLRQTVWPIDLAVFYPHPATISGVRIPLSTVALCAIILLAVSIAALLLIRRAPWFAVGWAWYLGTLVPVIGIVQVGGQSHADRYTYLSIIGITIAVMWSLDRLVQSRRQWAVPLAVCGTAALAALCILSWRQIGVWRNSDLLMRHAIAAVPNNYLAYNNLGHELVRQGDTVGAEQVFRKMIEINPADASAMNNVAVAMAARGEDAEAEKLYRRAIQTNPRYVPAYVHLGNLYARQGRKDAAVELYQQAIARDPQAPEPYHNLATVAAEVNQFGPALENWKTALRLKPDYADAHHSYGVALVMTGHTREGIDHLRQALQIEPNRIDTMKRLAWVLATHPQPAFRDAAEAVRLAQQGIRLSKDPDPILYDTLAAARAQAGDFILAVPAAETALKIAESKSETSLAQDIRSRLELYRQGKSYVQGG